HGRGSDRHANARARSGSHAPLDQRQGRGQERSQGPGRGQDQAAAAGVAGRDEAGRARLEGRLPAAAGDRTPQRRAGESRRADRRAKQDVELKDEQLLRYSRHILLPEIGVEGQERLRAAAALIVGAGGLGCPAALYLAAAGIGRLSLADADKVDLTNLQRQILYRTDSVGRQKVEAARAALHAMNPEVEVVSVNARVD